MNAPPEDRLAELASAERALDSGEADREEQVLVAARALARSRGETISLEALRAATRLDPDELDRAIVALVAAGELVVGHGGESTFIRVTCAGASARLRALVEKVATDTWVARGRPVAARLEAWIDAQRIVHVLSG